MDERVQELLAFARSTGDRADRNAAIDEVEAILRGEKKVEKPKAEKKPATKKKK